MSPVRLAGEARPHPQECLRSRETPAPPEARRFPEGSEAPEGDDGGAAQAARDEPPELPVVFESLPPFESEGLDSDDLDSEGLDSVDFESGFEASDPSADSDFPLSLLLPLSRKSVTYHPSPLRWNAAALISFLSLSFPQDGHLRLDRH